MKPAIVLCASVVALLTLTAQPPQTPLIPTPDETSRLRSKVEQLHSTLESVRHKHTDPDLLADVEIYEKAGRWLLEFPEDFFTEDGINHSLAVLDAGLERAKQLDAGQPAWMKEQRRIHGFHSALDGSVQPYGVTLPASYDEKTPARLYVWMHGRAARLTESEFLFTFPKQGPSKPPVADAGQIQLDVYGRWNGAGYHFAGETDVFEAIAEVQRRYKIDPNRILLRGFSMGGEGAWHIALHHPDRFAAAEIGAGTWSRRAGIPGQTPYQQATLRVWENMADWALNVFNLPLAGHDGDHDTQVACLPPYAKGVESRGQLESSIKVREQLVKEGFPSEGEPDHYRAKGTPAVFFISQNTGHGTSPLVRGHLDAFLKEYGDRGRLSPDHLRFVTYTTRYNQDYWATLDELQQHYERAELDATREDGGRRYRITTRNVARLTLGETGRAREIVIDGQSLRVTAAPAVTLAKSANAWRVAPNKQTGLHKTHGLQGPIDDAFLDPFLLVRPTGKPWNQAVNDQALRSLARFDRFYAKFLRAHPRVKDDKDVTAADLAKFNLVLFGDPGSNRWIARLNGKLPIEWTATSLSLNGRDYQAKQYLPALVYPNPLNPSHYVVINSGLTISDREYRGDYGMPRLGDVAVLRVKDNSEEPDIAWAGLFDESWQLPKPAQNEFPEATPESQGIDSAALAQAIGHFKEKNAGVHSLLLIRHGKLVLDTYFYPYAPNLPHDAASVTKSITSILIGMAADRGLLQTEQKVLPFFPKEAPQQPDPREQAMTVDDLLTMRPGLDCGFLPGEQELGGMRQAPDWVRFALHLPVKFDPGTRFGYCSPGFHVLSSIVTAVTGSSEFEFAQKNLFQPLGIEGVIWPPDPQGRTHGWGDSHLLPRDFARIGALYLHGGSSNGVQIVSSDWVRRSVAVHTEARKGVDYGYGWWLYNQQQPKTFEANGRGGQRIIVAPAKDLIVVITGGGYNAADVIPPVLEAVKSDTALPPNPQAEQHLRTQSEAAARAPAASETAPLPAFAASISGKTIQLEPNASRLESLTLQFDGAAQASLRFRMLGQDYSVPVGLDGVYRLAASGPYGLPLGAMGHWTSPADFLLDLNLISNINHYLVKMHCSEDGVALVIDEASGLARNLTLAGKIDARKVSVHD